MIIYYLQENAKRNNKLIFVFFQVKKIAVIEVFYHRSKKDFYHKMLIQFMLVVLSVVTLRYVATVKPIFRYIKFKQLKYVGNVMKIKKKRFIDFAKNYCDINKPLIACHECKDILTEK